LTCERETRAAAAVGQHTVVANAVETIGQEVQQKAAHELANIQRHGLRFEPVVAALRALCGIDTASAIGLVCEIGDINRFSSARQLMGYLGLVPSEHSSGNSIHRGSITKTGNAHARRLLTEAAWNCRFPARLSRNLGDRSDSVPEAARSHPWKAQVRLCGRFARLSSRGVQVNKVCVAVARELAGFVWAIAHQVSPAAPPIH
jgi:transposase